MSQYYGGYYLRTKEKEDWNKIKEAKIKTSSEMVEEFFRIIKDMGPEEDGLSNSCGMDICLREKDMDEVISQLGKLIGYGHFMFVGVTSNINVDPYTYLAFNFYNVKNDTKYLDDEYQSGKYNELYDDSTIFDIDKWLEKYSGFIRFGKKQKEYLLENYGLALK